MQSAWSLWISKALSIKQLIPALTPIHRLDTSMEFFSRRGLTLVRGLGDCQDEVSSAASELARKFKCKTIHLYGEFGSVDAVSSEAFGPSGELEWTVEPPAEPRGDWARHRAYWKLHRTLHLPEGTTPLVLMTRDEPFSVIGSGWRELGSWLSDSDADTSPPPKWSSTAFADLDKSISGLAAKARKSRVTIVCVDVERSRLLAATQASVAALKRTLKKNFVLLRKCPEAGIKLFGLARAYSIKSNLSGTSLLTPKAKFVNELRKKLGANVHVCWKPQAADNMHTPQELEWLTDIPLFSSDHLLNLSPRELVQAVAECGQRRDEISLNDDELEGAAEHMRRHAVTFAPLIVERMLKGKRDSLRRVGDVLTENQTKRLTKDTRYVKGLQSLYRKERISLFSDALSRVGANASA